MNQKKLKKLIEGMENGDQIRFVKSFGGKDDGFKRIILNKQRGLYYYISAGRGYDIGPTKCEQQRRVPALFSRLILIGYDLEKRLGEENNEQARKNLRRVNDRAEHS